MSPQHTLGLKPSAQNNAATSSGYGSPSNLAKPPLQAARFSSLRRPQPAYLRPSRHNEASPDGQEDEPSAIREKFKVPKSQPRKFSKRKPDLEVQIVKVKAAPFPVAQPILSMEFKRIDREFQQEGKSDFMRQAQQMQKLIKGPYEKELLAPRKQTVLGLKYIYDRYGYKPRRRTLRLCELPEHIDHVAGYHNLSTIMPRQPPGLDKQPGQSAMVEQRGKSVLCQYQHQRMRRSSHGVEPLIWKAK